MLLLLRIFGWELQLSLGKEEPAEDVASVTLGLESSVDEDVDEVPFGFAPIRGV